MQSPSPAGGADDCFRGRGVAIPLHTGRPVSSLAVRQRQLGQRSRRSMIRCGSSRRGRRHASSSLRCTPRGSPGPRCAQRHPGLPRLRGEPRPDTARWIADQGRGSRPRTGLRDRWLTTPLHPRRSIAKRSPGTLSARQATTSSGRRPMPVPSADAGMYVPLATPVTNTRITVGPVEPARRHAR